MNLNLAIGVLVLFIYGFIPTANAQVPKPRYQHIFQDVLYQLRLGAATMILQADESATGIADMDSVDGKYRILFRPSYFDLYPDVIFIGALCHELGHVFYHHIGPTTLEKEMAADIYCGEQMRKLSFQRVEDAYEFLVTVNEGTEQYSPKEERKKYISQGWQNACPQSPVAFYTAYNPVVQWESSGDTLVVKLDDRIIKGDSLFTYKFGIFYDSSNFATYQLDKFSRKNGSKGAGRMVNNKTTLVYRKIGRHSFILYERGEELPISPCYSDLNGYYVTDGDLKVTCYDDKTKQNVTYLLRNYAIAAKDFLFPVYKK
ncbi:MAG: hypothetical protein J7623_31435 [Chitinophaga sp.]|uniref:hypothetical protein n=1 Tax=Chitinophaga sp. TaxID=1869181 RepID=UPI001B0C31EB|nr:hypothetical protein [Chitinophaga sp.]MBO9733197.1 hypothetical protein [Chitinophaga sp.]